MMRFSRCLWIPLVGFAATPGAAFTVSTNFESASAQVLAIDRDAQTLRIRPAGDPKRGWPCWWYFRVDGVDPERAVALEVVANTAFVSVNEPGKSGRLSAAWSLPAQATFSTNGISWEHTLPGTRSAGMATYRLHPRSSTVWIAWGPPFTGTDAVKFVDRINRAHPFAKSFTLCRSTEGRRVPALQIAEGERPARQRYGVWITARQHAWESGGSWVARGLVEWLVSDDAESAWLRQRAEIFVLPLMDVDHVATGDGGKWAQPQDHNRDWTDTPFWPEVVEVKKRVLAMAGERRLDVFLDLHNPGASQKQQLFYVIDPAHVGSEAAPLQDRFIGLARDEFGAVKLEAEMPRSPSPEMMRSWGSISAVWVGTHGNPQTISFSVETPWNTPQSTAEGYQAAGRKLGTVLARYLRGRGKTGP